MSKKLVSLFLVVLMMFSMTAVAMAPFAENYSSDAAVKALELLKEPCEVTLYSDSKYLVDAFLQGWVYTWRAKGWKRGKEELKNPDLWERLFALTELHKVTFVWVKGHAGHDYNERCDILATTYADSL